ncbi:MAG: response regulator, partial [Acidobacteriota bacterium]|nr:response regulator [Acidobacteriota bacterium]
MKLDFDTNLPALTSTAFTSTDETNEVSQKLQAGVKAAQEGNRAEAKTLLLQVTEIEPENENAWLWLASISEYPEELLVFLNHVLSINPANERALQWAQATNSLLSKTFVERGTGAARDNQKSFAKQCFLQATVYENENETAWLRLASLSDSVEEKTAYLNKILSFDPESEAAIAAIDLVKKQAAQALLPQAIAEAFAGEGETALETLEKILAQAPEMEEGWLLKSYLVATVSEKIACFDKVLAINFDNEMARANDNFLRLLTAKLTEPQMPVGEFEAAEQIYKVSAYEETVNKAADEKYAVAENFGENKAQGFTELEDQEHLLGETYFAEIIPEDGDSMQKLSSYENLNQAAETSFEPETELNFQSEEESSANSLKDGQQSEVEQALADSAKEEVSGDFDMPNQSVTQHDVEMNYANRAEDFDKSFGEDEEIFDMPELPAATPDEVVLEELKTSDDHFENNRSSSVEAVLPSYYEMDEEVLSLSSATENNSPYNLDESEAPATELLDSIEEPVNNFPTSDLPETFSCPFCNVENEPQTFACMSCQAMLSLSDLEMLLAHAEGDNEIVRQAVEQMEAEKNTREFSGEELKFLGIGLINLKKLREGFVCLQQAAEIAPTDVLLSSQTNALANRLSEIEGKDDTQSAAPKNKTILVVDDSATVRKLISGKLEKCGHEVFCAIDGIDALEKIAEIMPDLILLDINMPRMDGYE